MQQIVGQLIFNGDPDVQTQSLTPWFEIRVMEKEVKFDIVENQTHRRFVKTHLPVDALVFSPKAKYIYVARDFPDIVWSLHNHMYNAVDDFYEMINNTPGRVGPALERPSDDIYAYWKTFLNNDCYPFWSFWENIRTWWEVRDLPNVKLVHFNDLKRDLPGRILAIADFLDIPIDEEKWEDIVEHCTFDWMKQHADQVSPMGGALWEGGGGTFINKGTNRRWKDVLSDKDIREYEAIAERELGPECTRWMRYGSESGVQNNPLENRPDNLNS